VATKRQKKARRRSRPTPAQLEQQEAFKAARKYYGGKIPRGADLSRFKSGRTVARGSRSPSGRRGGDMISEVVGLYTGGAFKVLPILGGKLVTRGTPMLFKLTTETAGKTAVATAASLAALGVVAFGVDRFGGRGLAGWGELVVAGGLLDVAESLAKRFGVPGSELLGDHCDVLAGHTLAVGTYGYVAGGGPADRMRLAPGAMGTYLRRGGMGTYLQT